MRIGIDGGCWNHRRGYGRFLRELLPALGRAEPSHHYTVYLDRDAGAAFDLGPPFEARLVETRETVLDSATAEGNRGLGDVLAMSRAVDDDLDLFFFPSVYSYFPLLRRTPIVLGIHDAIADRNPAFSFASKKQELLWRAKVRMALAQADAIVTVSQYSKRVIADWFHLSADKIAVMEEAPAAIFRRQNLPRAERPFVLYVGGISPNKNLPRLIRAFAQTEARRSGAHLILVGDYQADGFKGNYAEVRRTIEDCDLSEQVILPGFVPDAELARLYNTCTVFAMPSLDEGFGLPAVEAMSCGSPVIVSSGNSLEEVVADAGLVVDPHSVDEIAAAIDRVFADPTLAQSLSDRAIKRAAQFSWDHSAEQLLAVFNRLQQSKSAR